MAKSEQELRDGFLQACINKKKHIRTCYEELGLYSEIADARKEPVFVKDGAQELHKRVTDIAKNVRASYRNDCEGLEAALYDPSTFEREIRELGQEFGERLWGEAGRNKPRTMVAQPDSQEGCHWENDGDRERIEFFLRCWIVRHAVRELYVTPKKAKGKERAKAVETSFDGNSDSDFVATPENSPLNNVAAYRAPEVPRMAITGSATEASRAANAVDQGSNAPGNPVVGLSDNSTTPVVPRSPPTPSKRKAPTGFGDISSGKLPKIYKDKATATNIPRSTRVNLWSVPQSPQILPEGSINWATNLAHRRQREGTQDTDLTIMPFPEVSLNDGVGADEDQVMTDHADLQPYISTKGNHGSACKEPRISAGPSGTYRNAFVRDSVLGDTQDDSAHPSLERVSACAATQQSSSYAHTQPIYQTRASASHPATKDEKHRRWELFKLLLSYLNSINQFHPSTYDFSQRDRLNSLLYDFWTSDSELLKAQLGPEFPRLKSVLEDWMRMRYHLDQFRTETGYLGQPGDEWRAYLRRMSDDVSRARASIAFVELKSVAEIDGGADGGGFGAHFDSMFDDDLAKVFDLLTGVEECGGAEEFGGVRGYNERLLEWFS